MIRIAIQSKGRLNEQSVELLQSGQKGLAALYIVGSLVLSVGCVVMGLYCAKSLVK
mgnify:CR=1 FL=1